MNYSTYFAMHDTFTPPFRTSDTPVSSTMWFIFQGEKLLVTVDKNGGETVCHMVPDQLGMQPVFSQFLGQYGSSNCFVAEVEGTTTPPPSTRFRGLRALFGSVSDDLFILAGRAVQVLHWHREHQFCGRCGTAMKMREEELAKICPACGFISFPRLSPAVIMSIIKGDQILLARAPRFPAGMYSTLAGFVEAGETLEEAVKREVHEEVDIQIENVRYVASQPWPFPHSVMIGFTADYVAGEIRLDTRELEDARWFSITDLPRLPSRITIARLLVDRFIAACSQ